MQIYAKRSYSNPQKRMTGSFSPSFDRASDWFPQYYHYCTGNIILEKTHSRRDRNKEAGWKQSKPPSRLRDKRLLEPLSWEMKAGFPGRWPSLNSDGVSKTWKYKWKCKLTKLWLFSTHQFFSKICCKPLKKTVKHCWNVRHKNKWKFISYWYCHY